MELRSTLRPSAVRLYGVRPAPLSCSSQRSPRALMTSPKDIAAPVPKLPNEAAELMARVAVRERLGAWEEAVAREIRRCGLARDVLGR